MRPPVSIIAALLSVSIAVAQEPASSHARMGVTFEEASPASPSFAAPFSALASPEARQNLLDNDATNEKLKLRVKEKKPADIVESRQLVDDAIFRPGLERLRAVFAVKIIPQSIAGVPTDVIVPAEGVAARSGKRVLINLHGGGFFQGAGLGGRLESIPIASRGKIKVISVDYRQGPEHRFPAASEDVAKVYRELLKQYQPQNIGIYGCSAGGWLTAESVAWFQTHGLPRPGAVGLFGAGAVIFDGVTGDSAYFDWTRAAAKQNAPPRRFKFDYFDVPGLDLRDPLVSPVYSPRVLAKFPPTLLISGTRDSLMSETVYTHSQLVKQGVDADLHLWEGAFHCSFAHAGVDPGVPETQEAWDVIVKFFDSRLGR